MNNIEKIAWEYASGFFLTGSFIDDWESWEHHQVLDFIEDNVSESYEDWESQSLYDEIKQLAETFIAFHKEVKEYCND